MLGYTRRAAAVLHALQRVEDERETIWTNDVLLAILDLSPVESTLAHTLRLDSVWSRTMREQFRLAWSGNPDWRHRRASSMSGFSLSVLLERAEQARKQDASELIAERHLAAVFADMLGDSLRREGIDVERLAEEVTAVELSPQRERIQEALELERLRFAKASQEIEQEAARRSDDIRTDMARRGLSQSGLLIGGLAEAQANALRRKAHKRVELRRLMINTVPELGTTEHLERLRHEIDQMVDAQWLNLPRWVEGALSEHDVRRILESSHYGEVPIQIKSETARELEILKREVSVGVREPSKPGVVVNIHGSAVAALNLGNVIGNIQSVIVSLQSGGNRELAEWLKDLIEKVAAAEELGDGRRDVIDSLTVIGEEAAKPQAERRVGVVRSLMRSVGAVLGHAAHLAQIWTALAPHLERHFEV